uniref:antitoxin MazE family protein n=1 Tax=Vaginimicrobium propionicum TaxID=1871034 RepID=UPI000970A311|nr:antitoxin MazE family protein [Vaginimicrobium propionicum]
MTVQNRVREYRKRMRARGYRLVQVWVPDVRTDEFAAKAHQQSLLAAQLDSQSDDQDFIEAVSADWGDE